MRTRKKTRYRKKSHRSSYFPDSPGERNPTPSPGAATRRRAEEVKVLQIKNYSRNLKRTTKEDKNLTFKLLQGKKQKKRSSFQYRKSFSDADEWMLLSNSVCLSCWTKASNRPGVDSKISFSRKFHRLLFIQSLYPFTFARNEPERYFAR